MSPKSPAILFSSPTPLQLFLWSPLKHLTTHLYRFLNSTTLIAFPSISPVHNKLRIVCISDTHNCTLDLPAGDILIHAGDLTEHGTIPELQAQIDWLSSLPHRHKIAIAGNHDSYLDPSSRATLPKANQEGQVDWKGVMYLQSDSCVLKFPDRDRKVKVFGAPNVPLCGGSSFAFQYPRHLYPWKDNIPRNTDILVTHTPPRFYHDIPVGNFISVGCAGLLEEIWNVRPRVHVFGHVHAGRGSSVVKWDGAQRAYERACMKKHAGWMEILSVWAWLDFWLVFILGSQSLLRSKLWPTEVRMKGTVLVNAAVWFDYEENTLEPIKVVDI